MEIESVQQELTYSYKIWMLWVLTEGKFYCLDREQENVLGQTELSWEETWGWADSDGIEESSKI